MSKQDIIAISALIIMTIITLVALATESQMVSIIGLIGIISTSIYAQLLVNSLGREEQLNQEISSLYKTITKYKQ